MYQANRSACQTSPLSWAPHPSSEGIPRGVISLCSAALLDRRFWVRAHKSQRPHEGASAVYLPRFAGSNELQAVAGAAPWFGDTCPWGTPLSWGPFCCKRGSVERCGEAGPKPNQCPGGRRNVEISANREKSFCGHSYALFRGTRTNFSAGLSHRFPSHRRRAAEGCAAKRCTDAAVLLQGPLAAVAAEKRRAQPASRPSGP